MAYSALGAAKGEAPVAAVTGAAGDIGRSICSELGRHRYRVVAWDQHAEGLEQAASEREGDGNVVLTRAFDITDAKQCAAAVNWLEATTGRLDVLVNNAGAWFYEGICESTDDHWRHVFEVNVIAPARLSRLLLPTLRASSRARIVNVGSKNGFIGEPSLAAYNASKAALAALTRDQATEFAKDGVLVNCVAPGIIDTASNADILRTGNGPSYVERIPLRRIGTPAEVARTVAFLCSEECTFATGATLLVDGGQLAGEPG